MKFDYSKLKGRMVEKGFTQKSLSHALKVSENTMTNRFLNGRGFKQSHILKLCELLGIGETEIGAYFFTPQFDQNEYASKRKEES